jgi:hypothetical protein
MNLNIIPYIGVGPIRFGMSRNEVRQMVGHPAKPFLKGPDAIIPTDAFDDIGLHVFYKKDDTCEAIEMFLAADPTFEGKHLIERPFDRVLDWLQKFDDSLDVDNTGATSKKCGIGIYAPNCEESPSDPVEAVIVFERGYYDN